MGMGGVHRLGWVGWVLLRGLRQAMHAKTWRSRRSGRSVGLDYIVRCVGALDTPSGALTRKRCPDLNNPCLHACTRLQDRPDKPLPPGGG